jgi:hypothetical protein
MCRYVVYEGRGVRSRAESQIVVLKYALRRRNRFAYACSNRSRKIGARESSKGRMGVGRPGSAQFARRSSDVEQD